MAIAAWLVWRDRDLAPVRTYRALRLWGWQLLLNAAWTPVFFGLRSPGLGLMVILPLFLLVAATAGSFRLLSRRAALLLLPYGAWIAYATYLNAGFLLLNS